MDDTTLLQRFARDGSPEAFRELVVRHTNFVYSCAVQRLHDAHAAQDVTQAVFLALALKAKGLSPSTPLPGWLYKATRFACGKYQRDEQRRKEREMQAATQQDHTSEPIAALWLELQPHLAAALDELPDKDREALFTRFYRQGSYRDVAAALHTSEDSARKRVDRALEKLRHCFTKQGVTLTVTGLAGVLTANAVQAAPAGLAATCASTALSGTLAATETLMLAKGAMQMMFMAKVKSTVLITAACVVVTSAGVVVAKQVTGSATPVSAPVVNQPVPVQMAQNNPTNPTTPITPPATADVASNKPKVETGVFTLRVTRDGLANLGQRTAFIPVKVNTVEQTPNGATDVPKVGDGIVIAVPDSIENRRLLQGQGNCRVNLVRQRIAFPKSPKLDHWQYRFPNDFPDTNIGDCQEVKVP